MDVWWIILLSFVAGFAGCMAVAGWIVAWCLWQAPPATGNVLKVEFIDPESSYQDADEGDLEEPLTTNVLARGLFAGDKISPDPQLREIIDVTRRFGLTSRSQESSITQSVGLLDRATDMDQLLLHQMFKENLSLREQMLGPKPEPSQTMFGDPSTMRKQRLDRGGATFAVSSSRTIAEPASSR